ELQKFFSLKGDRSSISFAVPHPHLWWPNGHGEQPLYRCRVWVESEGVEIDEKTTTFGIRTVRLVRENEAEGQSFIIEVNGKPIFCKGMDWIPCDNFIPRISDLMYERLLSLARDAHATMIRVWGGGIYEQDMFYELCDRFGLMVWQDFMFACGEYPEDRWFLRLVQDEAEKAVTRLRNHPSLSLWCGNNECEWIFCRENPGKTPDAMTGAVIFNKLLPSVCRALDGTRPYWRSSPFGEGFPNAESSGNHHQWSMWGEWIDYKEYEKDCARFVTEFGFQAPPNTRTIEQVTIPSDRYPQSMVLEHHNKLPEGTERLFRFIAAHYAVNGDFEDYVYKGQLVQAEALKTAVEHWRRRKFKTAGSLFWQLNDCWPVTSWSVIDSALRPKAAYFYSKKFFAPLLVSFKKGHGSIEVWATNDLSSSVTGELKVSLLGFDGVETWSKIRPITLGRNASKLLLRIENAATGVQDPTRSYLLARLQVEGVRRSENRFFFAEPKHVRWQPASVTMELAAHEGETYLLTLSSQTLAKNVRIDVEDDDPEIDDNFFDLDPGESKTVRLVSRRPEEFIRSKLRVRTLWS
ncbi:MAG TPA: glycoside hydrolase family 2 protein, partial [Bacteroidota bacterium]